jgi:hypothetical protein
MPLYPPSLIVEFTLLNVITKQRKIYRKGLYMISNGNTQETLSKSHEHATISQRIIKLFTFSYEIMQCIMFFCNLSTHVEW